MHYVYILGHNSDGNFTIGTEVVPSDVRRYDGGKSAYQMLTGPASWPRNYNAFVSNAEKSNKWALLTELFKDIMWCSMPLSSANITDPHNIPGDAKVRIRVPKPFRYGLSTATSPANTSYTIASTAQLSTAGTHTMTPLNSDLAINAPSMCFQNHKMAISLCTPLVQLVWQQVLINWVLRKAHWLKLILYLTRIMHIVLMNRIV